MFICQICKEQSKPGEKSIKVVTSHKISGTRVDVEKEITTCVPCAGIFNFSRQEQKECQAPTGE